MQKNNSTSNKNEEILRIIPSIDIILNSDEIRIFSEKIEHNYLVSIIRHKIEQFRNSLISGERLNVQHLIESIRQELSHILSPYFCYAINATGIILHTGLGRAPFIRGVDSTIKSLSSGYMRLQIDDDGRRSDRFFRVNYLLKIITDAEAGMIVNNNAAATLLILNTIANGREVIISRGQLIEIGGDFRLPEIMAKSGALMREVGTTNRTHLKDYESALNDKTAAILRVHQSNYRISGFTNQVALHELVELGRRYNIPIIDDLGSGALIDFSKFNLPKEPVVQESVKIGADVVCFSGDKLLGGPQCGIIIGKNTYLESMKKNPLARALRSDKMASALLESTLQLFLLKEDKLVENHKALNMLLRPVTHIRQQARRCGSILKKQFGSELDISINPALAEIGGGSLSTEQLPTFVITIKPKKIATENLAKALRQYRIPIFGRVTDDTLLLDFRTIFKGEEKIIIEAFREILSKRETSVKEKI